MYPSSACSLLITNHSAWTITPAPLYINRHIILPEFRFAIDEFVKWRWIIRTGPDTSSQDLWDYERGYTYSSDWIYTIIIKPDTVDMTSQLWRQRIDELHRSPVLGWTVLLHTLSVLNQFRPLFSKAILFSYTVIFGQEKCIVVSESTWLIHKRIPRSRFWCIFVHHV